MDEHDGINKTKNKKYQTVWTVPKSNRKIVEETRLWHKVINTTSHWSSSKRPWLPALTNNIHLLTGMRVIASLMFSNIIAGG